MNDDGPSLLCFAYKSCCSLWFLVRPPRFFHTHTHTHYSHTCKTKAYRFVLCAPRVVATLWTRMFRGAPPGLCTKGGVLLLVNKASWEGGNKPERAEGRRRHHPHSSSSLNILPIRLSVRPSITASARVGRLEVVGAADIAGDAVHVMFWMSAETAWWGRRRGGEGRERAVQAVPSTLHKKDFAPFQCPPQPTTTATTHSPLAHRFRIGLRNTGGALARSATGPMRAALAWKSGVCRVEVFGWVFGGVEVPFFWGADGEGQRQAKRPSLLPAPPQQRRAYAVQAAPSHSPCSRASCQTACGRPRWPPQRAPTRWPARGR